MKIKITKGTWGANWWDVFADGWNVGGVQKLAKSYQFTPEHGTEEEPVASAPTLKVLKPLVERWVWANRPGGPEASPWPEGR